MRFFSILFILFVILLVVWILGSYFSVKNLEEPTYKILTKKDGYEIRQYDPYIVAEVQVSGNQREALNTGFKYLAGYIFGGNSKQDSIQMTTPVTETNTSEKIDMTVPVMETESEKISMTAPVLETAGSDDRRIVQFTMPSKYTLESLPQPDSEEVKLREIPAKKVAVLSFTGYVTEKKVQAIKRELQNKLFESEITPIGNMTSAQYNPPLSFPFTRRNEILVEVE
ncbi:heme-binding protein [Candidatus Gracilibacteria bacterium]|nr:heme-binding protein [Candidatus Gracilibacteria bacterium]